MDTESNKSVCTICGKTFSKNSYRNKHLKNVHKITAKGEKLPDSKFTCVLCDRKFKTKFCLDRHMTAIHFVENRTSLTFQCDHCGYKSFQKCNLKRHIKKHYKPLKNRPLKCAHCNASFKYLKHLKYHVRKIHSISNSKIASVKRKCPLCSFIPTKNRRVEINTHFKEIHDIPLRWEAYTFDNLELFHDWKSNLEKSTTAFYREKEKSKHYVCHRSGSLKTNAKNVRNMKITGSFKINAFCPSEIKLNVQPNGLIEVKYLPCHVGHKNELKYLRLTREDKNKIASQLLNKTPHDSILMDIRTSLRNCDLQRIHLATKKDISNIERSFNLNNEAVKHPYDPISIASWVKELKTDKNTSLLHFKPQGVVSTDFPNLKEEDFLLIFMTNAQKTMLKAHGNDIISIDSTHGLNKYNFQLYTLLVFDDSREGFPVSFMFTNRSDEHVVSLFFQKIKEICDNIKPNVFMSDMEETFYTAWCKVMGPSNLRIFCTWHVLKAWRENLHKIKSKVKKEEAYKIIKTLLYELDKDTFHKLLDAALINLNNDEETKDYCKYFEEQYVRNMRYKRWSYSYRINSGVNTNMSLENFNKVLKYCYLRGKKIQRLDKTLCAILNLLRDKLFDWIIKMKKGKVVSKLRLLRQRHKKSFLISKENIMETDSHTWQVLSATVQEFYTVKKIQQCSRCLLKCDHCTSCFHEYICSCMDSSIKNNMCKHIHLVARAIREKNPTCTPTVSEEKDDELVISEETRHPLECDILNEVCIQNTKEETRKSTFKEKIEKFVNFLQENANNEEQMEFVENMMRQTMSTVVAMATASGQLEKVRGTHVHKRNKIYKEKYIKPCKHILPYHFPSSHISLHIFPFSLSSRASSFITNV